MALSEYHKKYAALPDDEIARRIATKREELQAVFEEHHPDIGGDAAKVAVIGCGDRRLVAGHRAMFEELLGKTVELTTFDVTTEHLAGEEGVVRHDCTEPLPGGPFDVTYGHVVLRFVTPEGQWKMLKNSYDALGPGGVSIQLLDAMDYDEAAGEMPEELHRVPLEEYEERLDQEGISTREVQVRYGTALVMKRARP